MFITLLSIFFQLVSSQEVQSDFCIGKGIQNPHPDPNQCDKFVTCLLDIAYVISCPSPLHWNAKLHICDWKESAGCQTFQTTASAFTIATTTIPTTTKLTTTKGGNLSLSTVTTPTSTSTPFVPVKRFYDAAAFCDYSKCLLPKCRCGGEDIPGGLSLNQTPQIVLLTFDGGVRESNYLIYKQLLDPVYKNPNGCPIKATFFVTHANTFYDNVKDLSNKGHEIADHSITDRTPDTWWKTSTYEELELEIIGQKQNIERSGISGVKGWRSPYLAIGENTYKVLGDNGFLYTSSISLQKGQRWWPYTLDYLNKNLPDLCPNCPKNSYPGMWEVPLNQWDDGTTSYTCSYFDACFRSLIDEDSDSVYRLFMDNFIKFYKDRKQPFTAFGHGAFFDHSSYTWRIEGFLKFLKEINNLPDVYIVTISQAISWIQNPTPLSQLKDFKPWQC